jgi:hypothetical protein
MFLDARYEVIAYAAEDYHVCDALTIEEARLAARTAAQDEVANGDSDVVVAIYPVGSAYAIETFELSEHTGNIARHFAQGAHLDNSVAVA